MLKVNHHSESDRLSLALIFLKRGFDFVLFGNILIAIATVCQALLTYLLLKIPADYKVICVLFLSTWVIYNFSILRFDLDSVESDGSPRMRILSLFYSQLKLLTVLSALALLPFLFFLRKGSVALLSGLGVLSILYSVNFIPYRGKKIGLRKIPGAKMFLISMIWTCSTVWFPAYESAINCSPILLLILCIKRFLFISAACITFDMKDLFNDKIAGLKTIPALIGINKARILCILLLSLYASLLFFPGLHLPLKVIYGLLAALLIQFVLVLKATEKRSDYFFFIWIDGMFILQYLLAIIPY